MHLFVMLLQHHDSMFSVSNVKLNAIAFFNNPSTQCVVLDRLKYITAITTSVHCVESLFCRLA